MKVLVALSSLLALGAAQYAAYPGYGYSAYNPYPFYAGGYNHYAPTTYAAATPYAGVPAVGVSSQYHAQDELGQFNYGYTDGLSTKTEYRRFDGATVGSYSYVDANGKVQTVSYTADDVNGFQVEATNLPQAPVANLAAPEFNLEAPVFDGQAPEPVQDTAEVAAAKVEFAKLYADAAAAAEAAPDTDAAEPVEQESARRRRSAVLLPALAKATFKTASLEKVEADTPADTTLLERKVTEHETYVPTTYAAPAFHYAPALTYAAPVVQKVEVKHVAAPAIAYAVNPFAYRLQPYGLATHFVHNVASEAKEVSAEEPAVVSAERRKRSAVLLPALAKATFKTASLEKVEADTPADTTLLERKVTEHETYVPTTYAAPASHYAPALTYAAPVVQKVEVKHVAAPAIAYAVNPFAYRLQPYGLATHFVHNVASEAKEVSAEEPAVVSAERRKRSAVLLPALAKATFKTASLEKVEADTPADTTLLERKVTEHETYVPITYAAPAFHYAPALTYAAPVVQKVEVKHVAAPAIAYAANPFAYGLQPFGLATHFVHNVAAEASEAKEVSAEEPAVISAERRKRHAVLLPALAKATFKTASLEKVEADTPADTTLLERKVTEHETYVPTTYAAPAFHYAPALTYAAPVVQKVEVKHVAAPAIAYAAPTVTYTTHVNKEVASPITYAAAPFHYGFRFHPYGLGAPLVYNVAAKTAEVEEKAE